MYEKILITGADGFLGTNIIANFEKKSFIIEGLVRKHKKNEKNIRYHITNLANEKLPKLKDIDTVIHSAAITNTEECQKEPENCMKVNVGGTMKVLELVRKLDAKMIFLSSSHVYGIPKTLPIKETHPTNPISTYGISKLTGENLCAWYGKTYNITTTILRLFNPYGPFSKNHQIIAKIMSQLSRNNKIKLGNVNSKRDFIFVDDVVEAIEKSVKIRRGVNIMNIGTGKSHKILDIVNRISNLMNIKIKIEKNKQRKIDIPELKANITSTKKKLNWIPKTDLDEGLRKSYNWYKREN